MISRRLTRDPKLVIVGVAMSVLPDLDVLLPGIDHRGVLHTPLFAFVVCASLWGASKDRQLMAVCAGGLMSHLVLDTVASSSGLMWLYPTSEALLPLGPGTALPSVLTLRVFLFVTPALYIVHRCQAHGEGPLELVGYLRSVLGWRLSRTVSFAVVAAMVYVGVVHTVAAVI